MTSLISFNVCYYVDTCSQCTRLGLLQFLLETLDDVLESLEPRLDALAHVLVKPVVVVFLILESIQLAL